MAWAVDMGVVSLFRCVRNVGSKDGDPASFLLRSSINTRIAGEIGLTFLTHHPRDCRRQRRLAMVYVTDRADIVVHNRGQTSPP